MGDLGGDLRALLKSLLPISRNLRLLGPVRAGAEYIISNRLTQVVLTATAANLLTAEGDRFNFRETSLPLIINWSAD
jgi:hypothetical protein